MNTTLPTQLYDRDVNIFLDEQLFVVQSTKGISFYSRLEQYQFTSIINTTLTDAEIIGISKEIHKSLTYYN